MVNSVDNYSSILKEAWYISIIKPRRVVYSTCDLSLEKGKKNRFETEECPVFIKYSHLEYDFVTNPHAFLNMLTYYPSKDCG